MGNLDLNGKDHTFQAILLIGDDQYQTRSQRLLPIQFKMGDGRQWIYHLLSPFFIIIGRL